MRALNVLEKWGIVTLQAKHCEVKFCILDKLKDMSRVGLSLSSIPKSNSTFYAIDGRHTEKEA